MESESKKSFICPKDESEPRRNIMKLHILGLILVLVLIVALWSSLSILGRSLISLFTGSLGDIDQENLAQALEYSGLGSLATTGLSIFNFVTKTLGVVSYIAAFVSLAISIFIIYKMKQIIAAILDESVPFEDPVKVKKAPYVWLGFLLGAYGGHLFALKKKRAWIFLGMGIIGMQIIPLFLYTTGISFADAFLACFVEKDIDGYIEIDDYPYWL